MVIMREYILKISITFVSEKRSNKYGAVAVLVSQGRIPSTYLRGACRSIFRDDTIKLILFANVKMLSLYGKAKDPE